MFTQELPHCVVAPEQEPPQDPLSQTWPVEQTLPQEPQFAGSVLVSMQASPHLVKPASQSTLQEPAAQTELPLRTAGQRLAQPPQLSESVAVSTHSVPHVVSVPQLKSQTPPVQDARPPVGALQGVLQLPQFSGSVAIVASHPSALLPLQSREPNLQSLVQFPSTHVVPGHALSHWPQ